MDSHCEEAGHDGDQTTRQRRRHDPTTRGARDKETGAVIDTSWEARVTLDDGRRKSLYGRTRAEVAQKLAATIRDRDRGALIARDERQTVATYLASWLIVVKPTIGDSTWENYELNVRRYIVPAFGRTRLAKLTPQQVQALMAEMLTAGLAPRTVRTMRAVLRRALNEALALGLVTRNVAALVRAPKAPRGEMHVYDSEQVRRLLEVGAAGTRLEALLTLAVTSGMREGELLGLHWRNVDLDSEYLQVQTSLRRLHDKGLTIRDVKTGYSRRKVELPEVAIEALRRHRVRQTEERLRLGELWQNNDLSLPQPGRETGRTCRVCSSGAIAA